MHKHITRNRFYLTFNGFIADALHREAVESVAQQIFMGDRRAQTGPIHRHDSQTGNNEDWTTTPTPLKFMVGMAGFEPTTPSPPD